MPKIGKYDFYIGCDPEVFVRDPNGQIVSAFDMIPGTKDEPLKVDKGMVQVDGMALEFGIDPAYTEEEFVGNISAVINKLTTMIPKDHTLALVTIAEFSKEYMDAQPAKAKELGCDPDYSAYDYSQPKPRPNSAGVNYRSAGGHVHVGWGAKMPQFDRNHIETCAALALSMDYYLGVPSLYWDRDAKRRSLYGSPGAFRPKPYGMEYRTLSNQWLLNQDLTRFVYRQTIKAIKTCVENKFDPKAKMSFFRGNFDISARNIIEQNMIALGVAAYERETIVQ